MLEFGNGMYKMRKFVGFAECHMNHAVPIVSFRGMIVLQFGEDAVMLSMSIV